MSVCDDDCEIEVVFVLECVRDCVGVHVGVKPVVTVCEGDGLPDPDDDDDWLVVCEDEGVPDADAEVVAGGW